MIRSRFYYCAPEGSLHMEVRGHAGWGPKGKDPVCGAVSSLVCTLGEAVERMYHQSMLRRCPRVVLEPGRAEIIAVPKASALREALIVFWFAELGLCGLAEGFPGNVIVEETMTVDAG